MGRIWWLCVLCNEEASFSYTLFTTPSWSSHVAFSFPFFTSALIYSRHSAVVLVSKVHSDLASHRHTMLLKEISLRLFIQSKTGCNCSSVKELWSQNLPIGALTTDLPLPRFSQDKQCAFGLIITSHVSFATLSKSSLLCKSNCCVINKLSSKRDFERSIKIILHF